LPPSTLAAAALSRRGLDGVRGDILGSLGFHARFSEKAEIAEPIDEAVLPGAIRSIIAVGQAAGHVAAVGQ